MGQGILREWQRNVIRFAASAPELKDFYLTGETALTGYYLRHRQSDDVDFFSFHDIDALAIRSLADEIRNYLGASQVRFSRLFDRHQFSFVVGEEEYKIGFIKYPFRQLQPPEMFDSFPVDSEYDIAVNKLMALIDRFDPKDFVDLYFLLPKYPLQALRQDIEKKFHITLEPLLLGSELAKVGRIHALPKMIKPLSAEQLKEFFRAEAKKLKPEILE